jgi:hypothetical protein
VHTAAYGFIRFYTATYGYIRLHTVAYGFLRFFTEDADGLDGADDYRLYGRLPIARMILMILMITEDSDGYRWLWMIAEDYE